MPSCLKTAPNILKPTRLDHHNYRNITDFQKYIFNVHLAVKKQKHDWTDDITSVCVLAWASAVHVITDILYTMASEEESVTADP